MRRGELASSQLLSQLLLSFVHARCCFCTQVKLDPDTWRTWAAILSAVPRSVLWLLRFEPLAESNLRAAARASGIEPWRLVFTQVGSFQVSLGCIVLMMQPKRQGQQDDASRPAHRWCGGCAMQHARVHTINRSPVQR